MSPRSAPASRTPGVIRFLMDKCENLAGKKVFKRRPESDLACFYEDIVATRCIMIKRRLRQMSDPISGLGESSPARGCGGCGCVLYLGAF